MLPLLAPILTVKNLSIILSAILLAGTIYVKGRYDGANKVMLEYAEEKLAWEKKINETQEKLNASIEDTIKTYIKDTVQTKEVIKYVKSKPTVVTKYIPDDRCEIPNSFVDLHNKAVDNKSLGELTDTNATGTSNRKLTDVAATITLNYYQYNEMKSKLEALQNIVKTYKKQQTNLIGIGSE